MTMTRSGSGDGIKFFDFRKPFLCEGPINEAA